MQAVLAALIAALFCAVFWPVAAQDSAPIWAGAYTSAQAERGRSVVQNHCSECHHEDLRGGEGPALVGPTFMLKWETHTVERLFHKIRDTMPSTDNEDVTERQKLDTVAYILQLNGFPEGNTELTDTAGALGLLRMVPQGGPAPPRVGALVRAIGCLQDSGAGQWTLTQSTEPQITTLDVLNAEEKQSAAAAAPGTQTIQLLSVFPSPVALKGQKVLARGLFITAATGPRINVMSLEPIAPDCGR